MKTFTKLLTLTSLMIGGGISAQVLTFSNSNSLLSGNNAGIHSTNSVLVCDVDGNGFDDIAILDENRYLHIEYQQTNGTFSKQVIGDFGGTIDAWGCSMADFDHNGYKDFVWGAWNTGGNAVKVAYIGPAGLMGSIVTLPTSGIASQNVNCMDVNGDGWADVFVCNDVNESKIWLNNGSGTLVFDNNTTINFNVTPGTTAPNDESGNYGSVWTDFDNDGDIDLYIIHCRQGQPSGDLRRTNVLFENNGSNVYTSNAAAHNLALNTQDWTGSFGDIDNDGDFDLLLTGHEGESNRILRNDGGIFTQITTLSFGANPQQSHMEDFNNDGWIDAWISGQTEQRFYINNGDNTFTALTTESASVNGSGGKAILASAFGDLNHDGKIDMYASYGTMYNNPSGTRDDRLWLNTTANSNHFLTLTLEGTTSNKDGLGARAFIYKNGSSWVKQTREVRASESYGTMNTLHLHFGLGTETSVDSVVVRWPSGQVTRIVCPVSADQFINIVEGTGTCALTCTAVNITPGGSTTICSGDSVQLSAPTGAGYSYLWSNGATTSSIYADSPGSYSVVVSTGPSCSATTPSINITFNPDETPTVTALGNTTFCDGGSVDITSSSASSYTWNNGGNTQTISATQTGYYAVTVPGLCGNFTSDSVYVQILNATAPTGSDVYLPAPNSTTLNATGSNVSWYDAATGGTLLGTGNNYTTPVISVNTTFYAENTEEFGGSTGNVGSIDTANATYSGNTLNGYLIFNVSDSCIIRTVEVATDFPGNRTIELRNSVGTVLNSVTVNIPAGISTITLDFGVGVGNNYQLGTNTADNQTTFSMNSPQLVRNQNGASYPYDYSGVLSITSGHTGTNPSSSAYYYFYDWYVEKVADNICVSERTPINVFITGGVGIDETNEFNLSVYPNPTTDIVNVEFNTNESSEVTLTVTDMLGKNVKVMNLGTVNGSYNQMISMKGLATGVYNVSLNINDRVVNSMIVVK